MSLGIEIDSDVEVGKTSRKVKIFTFDADGIRKAEKSGVLKSDQKFYQGEGSSETGILCPLGHREDTHKERFWTAPPCAPLMSASVGVCATSA